MKINIDGIVDSIVLFFKDIGIGALIGGLAPLALLVVLALLGFTLTGVVGGSIAACCQAPDVLAGGCFATMQSVAATASLLPFTPYTAIVGAVGGLIYFIVS